MLLGQSAYIVRSNVRHQSNFTPHVTRLLIFIQLHFIVKICLRNTSQTFLPFHAFIFSTIIIHVYSTISVKNCLFLKVLTQLVITLEQTVINNVVEIVRYFTQLQCVKLYDPYAVCWCPCNYMYWYVSVMCAWPHNGNTPCCIITLWTFQ